MIAIISDIHANLEALKAVLEDIREKDISRIAVLGDVVGYGADPKACLDLLRTIKPEVMLMGNHEHALINGCPHNMHPRAKAPIEHARNQLGKDDLDWIASWEESHTTDNIFLAHASPRDYIFEYIFPFDVRQPNKMVDIFNRMDCKYCAVGHVHIPGVFTESLEFISHVELMGNLYYFGDEKAIINVGSVGQPRDTNNRSCYVTHDGECVVFHRVSYDFRTTQKKILEIPNVDPFLAQRLEIGR